MNMETQGRLHSIHFTSPSLQRCLCGLKHRQLGCLLTVLFWLNVILWRTSVTGGFHSQSYSSLERLLSHDIMMWIESKTAAHQWDFIDWDHLREPVENRLTSSVLCHATKTTICRNYVSIFADVNYLLMSQLNEQYHPLLLNVVQFSIQRYIMTIAEKLIEFWWIKKRNSVKVTLSKWNIRNLQMVHFSA